MHFCRLHKRHQDPILTLSESPIPVVEETKFLGVMFDRKLSFIPTTYYASLAILHEEQTNKPYYISTDL